MHWQTNKMIQRLSKIKGIKSIKSGGYGGDYDTNQLEIKIDKGETLYLCGFRHGGRPTLTALERDDCKDIDFLELTAGFDSRGGVEGCKKPNTFTVYGKIKISLERLNVDVAGHYDEYW